MAEVSARTQVPAGICMIRTERSRFFASAATARAGTGSTGAAGWCTSERDKQGCGKRQRPGLHQRQVELDPGGLRG